MNKEEIERISAMLEIENGIKRMGAALVAGVDEAGRGPLAGDVFAAAVILPDGSLIEGINDSKKLSEKKRELLFEEITKNALCWCVARSSVEEIEEMNIRRATFLAMNRAVAGLKPMPNYVLIDGDGMDGLLIPHECVVKGDSKCLSIAAASILAKVSRDRYMEQLDTEYPGYGFAKHKGYGTKAHIEAIRCKGACPVHRKSFLKNIL